MAKAYGSSGARVAVAETGWRSQQRWRKLSVNFDRAFVASHDDSVDRRALDVETGPVDAQVLKTKA